MQEACPRVVITANTSLNVRARPSTDSAVRAQVSSGRTVDVIARTSGQSVQGISRWFEVQAGAVTGFVSGAFARCTQDQAAPPPSSSTPSSQRYKLPLTCGSRVRIAQGNFGSFSHQNRSRYAYDFSIAVGTPMLAMKDGVVVGTYDRTGPGHRCYNGGGSDCFPHANWVALRHPDGRQSIYKHLRRVDVAVGQRVTQGQVLGLSGSTGYSTGPHAHVMRQQDCSDPLRCDSVELTFADVAGNGIPRKDQVVTSGNCR